MPPSLRNPSGIFQLFGKDNQDKLARRMQTIGIAAFTVGSISGIVSEFFNKFVSAHTALEIVLGSAEAGGFFLWVLMFIGVGARVMGQQQGVIRFGGLCGGLVSSCSYLYWY